MKTFQILGPESSGPDMAQIDVLLGGCYLILAVVALIAAYRIYRTTFRTSAGKAWQLYAASRLAVISFKKPRLIREFSGSI